MNAKKCGWLFLCTLLVEGVVTALLVIFSGKISLGIMESLLLSQLVVFVPAVLFLVAFRQSPGDLVAWRRPRLITSLLVIVFTYLCMPLIVTVNAISMLFVDNEVASLQVYLQNVPIWQMLLMVGIIGPVSEEFVFRGVIYHGFCKSGRIVGAMLLSAFLFGLTHLNFNQMSYAIVVGVIAVLLIEATGSIFYSMLFHITINLSSAVQMALTDAEEIVDAQAGRQLVEQTMQMPYRQALCIAISMMAVVACFATALAACLLYAIARREERVAHISEIFRPAETGQKKEKLFSAPLVIAIVLCLGYMILDLYLSKML